MKILYVESEDNQVYNIGFESYVDINEYAWYLIFKLYQFTEIVRQAKIDYDPSLIAKYLIDIAQDFNKWYANEKFIDSDEYKTEARLLIASATSIVLKEGMRLLGIQALNKM